METILPSIISGIAIICSAITAWIGFYTNSKNTKQKYAFELITAKRIERIDTLRDEIADYVRIVFSCFQALNEAGKGLYTKDMNQKGLCVRLRINYQEYKEFIEMMNPLETLAIMNNLNGNNHKVEFSEIYDSFLVAANDMLEKESTKSEHETMK